MNTHSFIPHRLFVAALSGRRKASTPPPAPPLRVLVETDAPIVSASLEERLQRQSNSAAALGRVLSLGTSAGI
ncbi:MAG TPA: hypothetical protein VI136_14105 [Verrucomicrobiae bacterium]